MSIMINNNLNKNILDFLILQTIAECKLNRLLTSDNDPTSTGRFYSSYKNNGKVFNKTIENKLKVAVGAFANLSEATILTSNDPDYASYQSPPNIAYEGGAGLYTKLPESQVEYFINNNLNKNVMDFLILQTTAECKLNRTLNTGTPTNPTVHFYDSYSNFGFINENINLIKVVVGYAPNLEEMDNFYR